MSKYINKLEFTIDGKVQPQQRPRFSRQGGFVKTYDPPESTKYKKYVAEVAEQYKQNELIDSPIKLTIDVYIEIPKSYTKKKRQQIESGELVHIKKPDVDNLAKGIKDGITGVLWTDDSLIVELVIRKHYGEIPRADIIIEW